MKTRHASWTAMLAVLLCAAVQAEATTIYKYRQADGGILYTQKRSAPGKLLSVLQIPSPTADETARRRAAQKELHGLMARAERMEMRRETRLAQADIDVFIGAPVLAQNQLALPHVAEPLPWEREGLAGGGSRLNEAYWARMCALGFCDAPRPEREDSGSSQMLFAR